MLLIELLFNIIIIIIQFIFNRFYSFINFLKRSKLRLGICTFSGRLSLLIFYENVRNCGKFLALGFFQDFKLNARVKWDTS